MLLAPSPKVTVIVPIVVPLYIPVTVICLVLTVPSIFTTVFRYDALSTVPLSPKVSVTFHVVTSLLGLTIYSAYK